MDGKEEAILEYELISLKSLSHFTRGALIEKWLKLGSPQDQHFSRRVTETERLIENVIGKNTLPSLPFITLAILEASDRNTEILPENGSFGYLYEVLITSALSSSGGKHPQLDKKYKFLSILAFQMFERKTEVISHSEVDALLDDYATRFKIKIDKINIVSDLTQARVLLDENGNYSFAYDHFFFYFLARHFKEGLTGENREEVRSSLMNIAAGLHTAGNSIFLMFVMYLTHDRELTEKLISTADRILTDYELSTLGDEVDFYSAQDSHARTRRVPEAENYQENRNEKRRQLDAMAEQRQRHTKTEVVRECGGYNDDLPVQTKLDYAFSCIQLMGQVLRNFTGSMPGDTKVAILTSTYRLGLRVLRHLLQNLKDASIEAKRVIEQQDQSRPEGREMVRQIERLLTMIGEIVGSGMILTIAQSVGSPDIGASAYEEAVTKVGKSNAVSLIDLSIKLDHSGEYPFNLIKQLVNDFSSSRLAHVILCNLVFDNMQVFEIDWKMRQRVISILKKTVPGEALVSKANKRLKGDAGVE